MASTTNNTHQNEPQPGSLQWTVHPVKRRPLVSLAVTVFVFLVAAVVYYAMDSRVFAVLAMVVMLMSLGKFYFPTHYALDEVGITIKTTTQTLTKEWKLYRSYYPDKSGVLLSPFPEPSRLENFRGVYVMIQDNREQVLAFVNKHIGHHQTATAADTKES
ncbi:MAG: hypothetical protein ABIE70_08345 [bacterium]